jgi:hypothetical protein
MSATKFLDFGTLEENVVYTAKTVQWVFGSEDYFYVLHVETSADKGYCMIIYDYSDEKALYDKLERMRQKGRYEKFTFSKVGVETAAERWVQCIVVAGDNGAVDLE